MRSILRLLLVCQIILCIGISMGSVSAQGLLMYDNTGMPILPRPTLKLTGGPLIVSNSPEILGRLPYPACLYRTRMGKDRFRVFYHHQNVTGSKLLVGIAIMNPLGNKAVDLYVARNSQNLPDESQHNTDVHPAVAGTNALHNWYVSRTDPAQDKYLATIPPGRTRYILQPVSPRETVTGMYDFSIHHKGSTQPTVTVSVIACKSVPSNPGRLPLVPAEYVTDGGCRRGVFAHSDRYGKITCDLSDIRWLDIAGPLSGKHARLMGNEMETAADNPRGTNTGNYGVVYTLDITLRNTNDYTKQESCLINAAGGNGYSVLRVDGVCRKSKPLAAFESWEYKKIKIVPSGTATIRLQFSLPGGCSGAQRLYF